MRAFLAIELPDAVKASLAQVSARLRKTLGPHASWVREQNLHITVRFLGEAESESLEQLTTALAGELAAEPRLPLQIGGLGVFPNPRRARILWSGGTGDLERLMHLHKRCESAARAGGFEPDERAWSPHVTLARFRRPPQQSALRKALAPFDGYRAGEFTASGVTLFSSKLTPRGAVHTPIRKFPFSCPST